MLNEDSCKAYCILQTIVQKKVIYMKIYIKCVYIMANNMIS